jgi:hypothetical protein
VAFTDFHSSRKAYKLITDTFRRLVLFPSTTGLGIYLEGRTRVWSIILTTSIHVSSDCLQIGFDSITVLRWPLAVNAVRAISPWGFLLVTLHISHTLPRQKCPTLGVCKLSRLEGRIEMNHARDRCLEANFIFRFVWEEDTCCEARRRTFKTWGLCDRHAYSGPG